jgi:cell division protein FtsQ
LERLPWVARAIVTRQFPDRLTVAIAERVPVAVWRHEKRDVLIDASGRQIVDVAAGSDVGLPVVSGVGGGPAAPTLLAQLAGYPDIRSIVVESRRIDDRRWTLLLADGVEVRLPADGVSAALARLDGFRTAGLLRTTARLAVIDLRLPDRLVVHPARAISTRNAAVSNRAVGADVRARIRME